MLRGEKVKSGCGSSQQRRKAGRRRCEGKTALCWQAMEIGASQTTETTTIQPKQGEADEWSH